MSDIVKVQIQDLTPKSVLADTDRLGLATQGSSSWDVCTLASLKSFVTSEITDQITAINSQLAVIETDILAKSDKTYVDTQLATKAELVHTHPIADIIDLATQLAGKASTSDLSTLQTQVSALPTKTYVDSADALKADKAYVDTQLAGKANTVHTHTIADVTNLQAQLDQLNVIRSYNRVLAKTTTTNETIPANTSIRILDRVTLQAGGTITDDFTFTSGTNAYFKEILTNSLTYKQIGIRLTFAHTASFGNTQLEVQIWRNTATPTLVASFTNLNISDPDARGVSSIMMTNVKGATDPYVTDGYYLIVKNLTGTVFTYSSLQVALYITRDRS